MLFRQPFSTRIALYFGVLYALAMAAGGIVWYVGSPWLHLTGARDQRLIDATSLLEVSANSQLNTIRATIAERRGDMKLLAESPQVISALVSDDAKTQGLSLELFLDRIERSYPDAFEDLRVIDGSRRVLASTQPGEKGQAFEMPEVLERATTLGATELVEEVTLDGVPSIAILRQIMQLDSDGYAASGIVGILVATIKVDKLLTYGIGYSRTGYAQAGASLIVGAHGNVLARLPQRALSTDDFWRTYPVANGFEGVLRIPDAQGAMQLAVYRHVPVNRERGWTFIHFQSEQEALRGLNTQVRAALWTGSVFAVMALLLILMVARHLTQPLRRLGDVAHKLGGGDLSTRAISARDDSREFADLADAFNSMADSVEHSQLGLEAQVIERTQALALNEDRLRLALAAGHLGVYDLNVQTGEASVNAEYATMLGFDPDTFKETYSAWMERLHPDDRERTTEVHRRYVAGENSEYQVEFRQRTCSGDWVWILSKGSVIKHDAQGHRRTQSLAIAYLDLDGFKAVNDAYGHGHGDELLIALAERMEAALRDGDTLARIGGDEFVAILVDLEQANDCDVVLQRLLKAAAAPLVVDNMVMQVSASIGVTIYPQDGVNADLLLRHADQAMYVAKQAGKNCYHLFDTAQDAAIQTRHESLEHIRNALDNEEFVLYYQPKVNMRTGQVIGAEALIRWQHPERGLLTPIAFLPLIEGHPISVEVGEWVINTALAQMMQWRASALDIPVSVNISAYQLQQGDFAARLGVLLAGHPEVSPNCLELEVLETSAFQDIVRVCSVMSSCHALGVRFALDDFGTGYSSLTYLRRLPAEVLKIDQSFVRDMINDPDDLAIVQGVAGLAAAFHREVIAEGVETRAHGNLLLSMGCELAQGYGIARPMPAADMPGWVASWHLGAVWTK